MTFVKNNLTAFIFAILIHVGFVALMVFSLDWDSAPEPTVNIIKATIVDEKKVLAEIEKLKNAEKRKLDKEKNRQNEAKKELDKIKKARQNEEKKRKEEQQKVKNEQQKVKNEQKRLADLKKLEEEEKKKAEALAKKHEENEKKIKEKQAAETKRLEALEEQRKDVERKLAEADFQRVLDEEYKKDKAAAESKKKQDAARDVRVATEIEKFIALIHQDVTSSWILPVNFKSGSKCTVRVKIIPGGEVADVKVSKCSGGTLFERSVDAAVRRASPLPVPRDPDVFDKMRDIDFLFNPK
ncbi:MAG: cell envelope integrity protein TolA [Gammaproteobacteria bacterium]|nr:cell envelope integrity protein TolA [Gammaproteobacteria bacterium]